MMSGTSDGGASFTALLDMPADQAVEILHNCGDECAGWRRNDWGLKVSIDYCRPKNQFLDFSPPLPSNLGFVDRSVRQSLLSATGGEDSPETTSILSNSSGNSFIVKSEPLDSESNPSSSSHPGDKSTSPMSVKRKDRERKVKESTKKSRSSSKDSSGDAEKLPYVHVRARRGQATDSHSLAERARREKINARMKLLQGLVPGCSKISGTALVLDEIINHVQSLQRQVEFLSMRLAAINPSADFTLDSLLVSNSGAQTTAESSNICSMLMPIMWQGVECGGDRDGRQVQPWQVDNQHLLWERGVDDGNHLFSSLYPVDNVTDSDWR